MMDLRPSLYRVAVTTLVIAAVANVLLWRVTRGDDTFADVIAVASAVVAVGLVVTAVWPAVIRLREEVLLVAFAMWTANAVEFWLQDGPRWESKARQGGFYLAFAVLALGTWLVQTITEQDRGQ